MSTKAILKATFLNQRVKQLLLKLLKVSSEYADTVKLITSLGFIKKELVKDLLRECVRMHKFEHPNVLKLSGLCLDGGPAPYIIMPFMANGSLLSHLKEERDKLVIDPEDAEGNVVSRF